MIKHHIVQHHVCCLIMSCVILNVYKYVYRSVMNEASRQLCDNGAIRVNDDDTIRHDKTTLGRNSEIRDIIRYNNSMDMMLQYDDVRECCCNHN